MLYDDWRRLLSEQFPPRDPATTQREWEALKRQLVVGQPVTGTVVAKAPFGAWIDLGLGFPALLTITVMAGLTPERYHADEWCPLGSRVTAFVTGFQDDPIVQVRLWQERVGHGRA
jgi:hypothetical protein